VLAYAPPGGPLERVDDEFACQWHAARFDVATGNRVVGPAPRGSRLMALPVDVVDGVVTYVHGEDDPRRD
jgi:nitrite reductase/ring-hydroxylating ferredoxin subunit